VKEVFLYPPVLDTNCVARLRFCPVGIGFVSPGEQLQWWEYRRLAVHLGLTKGNSQCHATPIPRPPILRQCRVLRGTPRGSRKKPNAGKSPACRLWTAGANSHMPCHLPRCDVTLKSRFQTGMVVAWLGMACVNQIQPRCVIQMGKTQFKPLA
jgi:hypothetical protein